MAKRNPKEVEAIVSGMGVFTTIISNLVELIKKIGGTMESVYRLATPEGNKTLEAIAQLIVDGTTEVKNQFLKLISGGHSLTLDAVDGKEILVDAKDVFAYIDSDLKKWGVNEKGSATGEIPVNVYEMTKDATFSQIFGSLSSDVRSLCFTQAQIKGFVKKHRNWLRTDGYGTFFLFKSHGECFVADVLFLSDDSLGVHVYRFDFAHVWLVRRRRRVVVPQLA